MKLLVAYTTFPDLDSAQKTITHLMTLKLISCANIVDGGHSFYWWDGKMQQEREVYVWIKTKTSLFVALEKELIAHHPYEVPCLWTIAPDQVHPAYLKWALDSIPLIVS